MTLDPDLPLDDDELAVAAVVDGDATADQRRRVARDPALVARARASEAVREALRAPVDGPGEDVFAALRARAVATVDDPVEEAPATVVVVPAPDPAAESTAPSPTVADELASRRARRIRRLPPLPAVAAVVMILLLGGIALLVTDDATSNERRADTASSADDSGGDSGASGGGSESADNADATADSPGVAFREDLLARASSSYVDEATLLDALRTVDPGTLDLTASPIAADGGAEMSTTTVPAPGDDDQPTSAPESTVVPAGADGRSLAEDEDVVRCDTVLRSAEPDVGPATAAVFVAVDGIPVLVLSNPVEASDDGPATIRLTVLNAVDCSPRGAVQR